MKVITSYIFIILLFVLPPVAYGQIAVQVTDTSDYMPLPEGLNYNLSIAASKGYAYEIHRLIKLGARPDEKDLRGATPLLYAVANNRKEAVNALLAYDPETDYLTVDDESPLLIAAKYDMTEIAEALIRKGADVDFSDSRGCTPLHYTAIYGYRVLSDMLLYYNASIDSRSNDGTTPLIASIWSGFADVADLLVQSGANTNAKDNRGFTPLDVAAQNGDTLIAQLLLDNGADIMAVNNYKYDALNISIRSGQKEMTEFLLKKMLALKGSVNDAIDPVLVAISYSRKDIVKLLVQNGYKNRTSFNFDQVNFGAYTRFVFHDIYTGGSIGFTDSYHKLMINVGADMKPFYTRVLVENSSDSYTQYPDKRYLFYAGISKSITLSESYIRGDYTLMLTLNGAYMISESYPGTYEAPDNRAVILPSVLINRNKGIFNIYGGLEYYNTGLYKAGPLWMKAGVSVNFYFNRSRAPLKDIKWY